MNSNKPIKGITKDDFLRHRDYFCSEARSNYLTAAELRAKIAAVGIRVDSMQEAVLNSFKFDKRPDYALGFCSFHLARGMSESQVIKELGTFGHDQEFVRRMIAKATATSQQPTDRAEPAEEVLIPSPVRIRGIVAELPHYHVTSEAALLDAVTDLLQRRVKPVQANDLVRCLSGDGELVSSRSIFGCLMELTRRGRANRFQVKGTEFFKFELVGRKRGCFSEAYQRLLTLAEMSEMSGIARDTLHHRIKRMSADAAMVGQIEEHKSKGGRAKFCSTTCSTSCSTKPILLNRIEPKMASSLLSCSLQEIDDMEIPSAMPQSSTITPSGDSLGSPSPRPPALDGESLRDSQSNLPSGLTKSIVTKDNQQQTTRPEGANQVAAAADRHELSIGGTGNPFAAFGEALAAGGPQEQSSRQPAASWAW